MSKTRKIRVKKPPSRKILRATAVGSVIRGGQSKIKSVASVVVDDSKVMVIKAKEQ